jgi:hypothetical protein
MATSSPSPKAVEAVERIVDDLTNRRGLRQEWENIDEEIQAEIKLGWAKEIDSIFFRLP